MAIDDLLDEHEQSERVLAWLRSNGAGLIGGVLLGLALIGGWYWWREHSQQLAMQAGDSYQAALKTLEAGNLKQAAGQVAALADTPYGPLAALDLAKAQVDAGQRDAAIASLRKMGGDDAGLLRIRDQRLARLLLDAGKPQDALKAIAGADDAAGLEVRGDIQLAMGKREDARKSYSDALTKLDVAAPQRMLLELKLTQAGGTPAKPEANA